MQTLSQVIFHRLDDEKYMFERRPQLLHRLQVAWCLLFFPIILYYLGGHIHADISTFEV